MTCGQRAKQRMRDVRARLMGTPNAPEPQPAPKPVYVPKFTMRPPEPEKQWWEYGSDFKMKKPKWRVIISEVADKHCMSVKELMSQSHRPNVTLARQEAIYRVRHELHASWLAIGGMFGRDHTTAIHSYRAYAQRLRRGDFSPLSTQVQRIGDAVPVSACEGGFPRLS